MSQQENSNWRDNYFPSKWHRYPKFPEEFLLTDLDAIEWRKNESGFFRPVGFFEYKLMFKFKEVMEKVKENNRLHWQLYLLKSLAEKCCTSSYFVGYEYGEEKETISQVAMFNIGKWQKNQVPVIDYMSEWEYFDFIQKL